ncbi:MAG: TonB-dependent receptor [Candidatus Kapabacteria bacterium]|nr:TonB-dependent receptor [Candidatus Kapabacteria bacterium]MDW8011883.1 TonB-dependent receptor [Bacteroidota bacterium]
MRGESSLLWLCCLWSSVAGVVSQDTIRVDTARYRFPPFAVEAQRPAAEQLVAVPITAVSAREIARQIVWQGAEALVGLPGVFIRDYGGLGGLKTISVRGLGATQTLVLLDGVRLNTALHGVYDVGNLPTSFAEELVLVAGGASALVGAYAGSGVVSVHTLPRQPFPYLRALLGVASFGEWRAAFQGVVAGETAVTKVGLQYLRSRGDYPFQTHQFGELRTERRQNGDYEALTGLFAVEHSLPDVRASLQGFWLRALRGVPGAVVQGRIEFAQARLEEADGFVAARFSLPRVGLEWLSAVRHGFLQYRDPEARVWGPRGAYDDAVAWEAVTTIRWHRTVLPPTSGWLQAELRREMVEGTLLRPQGRSEARRWSATLAASLLQRLWGGELVTALRWEAYRQYAPAFCPLVGLQYAWQALRLRVQWSHNFRPPSFAELYYFNFGSPDLRPERTESWNVGVEWAVADWMRLRADAFTMWVRDQIVAVPRSPVFWSARNVGLVWSRGVEVAASVQGGNWLRLAAHMTWQRVTDQTDNPYTRGHQLPYVPMLLGAAKAELLWSPVEVTLQLLVTGQRWSQPDNAPESTMPPYGLLDCALSYQWPLAAATATFRVALRNAGDVRYEVIRNYPLPGRSVRAEVELRWSPHGKLPSHARH